MNRGGFICLYLNLHGYSQPFRHVDATAVCGDLDAVHQGLRASKVDLG
jgi:hypothetical protein